MFGNGAAPEAGVGAFTSPYGGRLSIGDSLKRLATSAPNARSVIQRWAC
jgi:hypothetical protein